MRKFSSVSIDERPRRRGPRANTLLLAGTLLALSPVIYESVMLCVAQWKGFFGVSMRVETPVLHRLGSILDLGREEISLQTHAFFHQGTWSTSLVVLFALFWTGVLAMLLRKCH
jgi:hypothetical protein